jgi:hypothetical protein
VLKGSPFQREEGRVVRTRLPLLFPRGVELTEPGNWKMTRVATRLRVILSAWKQGRVCGSMLGSLSPARLAVASFYPKRYSSLSNGIVSRITNHSAHRQMHTFCSLFTNATFGGRTASVVETGNGLGIQPLLGAREIAEWVSSFLKFSTALRQLMTCTWTLRSAMATARTK